MLENNQIQQNSQINLNTFNLKKAVGLILPLVLIIVLVVTVLSIRGRQDIRKKAAGSGAVSLLIDLSSGGNNLVKGSTYTATVSLVNTGTVSKNIYTGGFVASFDQSVFTISPTSVTCDQGNYPLGIINNTTTSTIALTCSKRGGEAPVALSPAGQMYSIVGLGSFQLTVNSTTTATNLAITLNNFVVPDAVTSLDLAKMPASFSWVINQGTTPPVATATPVRTPTPTTVVLPTATKAPVPTATPTRAPTVAPSPTPTTAPGGTVLSETRGNTWINLGTAYGTGCYLSGVPTAFLTSLTLPIQRVSKIMVNLKWTTGTATATLLLQDETTTTKKQITGSEKTVDLPSLITKGICTSSECWVPFDYSASPLPLTVSGTYSIYLKKAGTATVQWKSYKIPGGATCDYVRNYQMNLIP